MDLVTLRVHPAAGGWWLDCDLPLQPTYFRSGARAEAVARGLAAHLAATGREAQVVITDRGLRDVAAQRYRAA